MSITTRAQLVAEYSSKQTLPFFKLNGAVVGNVYHTAWKITGTPGAGVTPSTAALCNNATTGAIVFKPAPTGTKNYIAEIEFEHSGGNSNAGYEFHDRLAHMAGLSGIVITAQTVGMNLVTLAPSAARLGAADYSEVQWWFEWYAATGATAVNASIGVTYNDGTTGTETVAWSTNMGASGSFRLLPITAVNAPGKFIRSVDTVTLSATTGTAGSFGVTASRQVATIGVPESYMPFNYSYEALGFPAFENDACLYAISIGGSTSTGIVNSKLLVVQG